MANQFDVELFKSALGTKISKFPPCPFCGCDKFSASDKYAALLAEADFDSVQIGAHFPCGVIFCNNCGHVELFALGTLGLLPKRSEE